MTSPTALTPEEQRTLAAWERFQAPPKELLAIIRRLDAQCVKTQVVPMCGTCGGVSPSSGKLCVCGGLNTIFAEVQGLREECFRLDARVRELIDELNRERRDSVIAASLTIREVRDLERSRIKQKCLIEAFNAREARLREALVSAAVDAHFAHRLDSKSFNECTARQCIERRATLAGPKG